MRLAEDKGLRDKMDKVKRGKNIDVPMRPVDPVAKKPAPGHRPSR